MIGGYNKSGDWNLDHKPNYFRPMHKLQKVLDY